MFVNLAKTLILIVALYMLFQHSDGSKFYN